MQKELIPILEEIHKAFIDGNGTAGILLTAILANGHVLLDDIPGVGKTTLAMSASRVLGLEYRRVQFTPDVLPSDITGFSMYDKQSGGFVYMPGVVTAANILLADEINRTSSKTQSALLEAMEERQVTVDGQTHPLKNPFLVIATQNRVGTAGTQQLPFAQLDRFLVCLKLGYPDFEGQMEIIRDRQNGNPVDAIKQIADCGQVLSMQNAAQAVTVKDSLVAYITRLAIATREHSDVELGISPRGALGVNRMAKALAYLSGRDYMIPGDVRNVFLPVCGHRILLKQESGQTTPEQILTEILEKVPVPDGEK
ncbi:MAG: MoxR family ATPase [Oscillospiraceae bacterium]|jgi:MoxR-like ATPase|nr:MoxR family ATPase [Oscillospiraceae bacterium]